MNINSNILSLFSITQLLFISSLSKFNTFLNSFKLISSDCILKENRGLIISDTTDLIEYVGSNIHFFNKINVLLSSINSLEKFCLGQITLTLSVKS